MKYSQVLVACIGGAALVSALPASTSGTSVQLPGGILPRPRPMAKGPGTPGTSVKLPGGKPPRPMPKGPGTPGTNVKLPGGKFPRPMPKGPGKPGTNVKLPGGKPPRPMPKGPGTPGTNVKLPGGKPPRPRPVVKGTGGTGIKLPGRLPWPQQRSLEYELDARDFDDFESFAARGPFNLPGGIPPPFVPPPKGTSPGTSVNLPKGPGTPGTNVNLPGGIPPRPRPVVKGTGGTGIKLPGRLPWPQQRSLEYELDARDSNDFESFAARGPFNLPGGIPPPFVPAPKGTPGTSVNLPGGIPPRPMPKGPGTPGTNVNLPGGKPPTPRPVVKGTGGTGIKLPGRLPWPRQRSFEDELDARDFDDFESFAARAVDGPAAVTTTPSSPSAAQVPIHRTNNKKMKEAMHEPKRTKKSGIRTSSRLSTPLSTPSSTMPSTPVSARDFEDELAARFFLFKALKAKIHTHKANSLQQKADAERAKAAALTGGTNAVEDLNARDFEFEIDELD